MPTCDACGAQSPRLAREPCPLCGHDSRAERASQGISRAVEYIRRGYLPERALEAASLDMEAGLLQG